MDIENKEVQLAYQLIATTGVNLFLTGRAGTGKTTFLKELKEMIPKNMVVLAPTGIAAINAGGMTIHSFFQLGFSPFIPGLHASERRNFRLSREKKRIIRSLDLLVIDEISMVRADLLDAIDNTLRRVRNNSIPFGGVQLLLIGDLGQLPPVVKDSEWDMLKEFYSSPYFFDSNALRSAGYETIELRKVYRQQEGLFLDILNKIRENKADYNTLQLLNQRYIPTDYINSKQAIRLVTHNHIANKINDSELAKLPSASHFFEALIDGDFPESSYPADKSLILKLKSHVMFIKNDTSGFKRYYNGMLGIVTGITDDEIIVLPADGGEEISLTKETWENNNYVIDENAKELKEVCVGKFTQFPLRKAWAITIHKSQGLTFDNAIIDASSAFTHGQTYVALSRCRTLEGLILDKPLSLHAIICDNVVSNFVNSCDFSIPTEDTLHEMQLHYHINLLDDLFNFNQLFTYLTTIERLCKTFMNNLYPRLVDDISNVVSNVKNNLIDVSAKFRLQYSNLIISTSLDHNHNYNETLLKERLSKAADYFYSKLVEIISTLSRVPHLDNKQADKRLVESLDAVKEIIYIKNKILSNIETAGIDTNRYLSLKTQAILESTNPKVKRKAKNKIINHNIIEKPKPADISENIEIKEIPDHAVPDLKDDIINPAVYNRLCNWRYRLSKQINKPAYTIAHTKTLIAISTHMPETIEALLLVKGVGSKFAEKYGQDVLAIINDNQ